jgi:hypothetical protein
MALADPAAARWPAVRPGRGHYESYYLRAVDPARPRGVWIRYTVSAAPGGPPNGQLWFTFFDRDAPRPLAIRVDADAAVTGGDAWIRLGESTLGPAGAVGSASSAGRSVSWSLSSGSGEPPLEHLPRDWMYRTRFPRTKTLTLSPSLVFDGTLEVAGETIDVAGWPGMVGHNWGEEHAARWIWLHGLAFDDRGADIWLDVAVGRVALGPVMTPWVANGALSLDGERLVLGGLGRRVTVVADDDHCVLRLPGKGVMVTATAAAPADAFVEWDYPGPDGSQRRVVNCSVADLTVRVERPGAAPVELTAPHRAAYELGREDGAVV